MKKLTTILTIALSFSVFAQNDTMFIHTGQNIFHIATSDVDSIVFHSTETTHSVPLGTTDTVVRVDTLFMWPPLPLPPGCDENTPDWGPGLLAASFATARTWVVDGTDGRPSQEWSDAVVAEACANRTTFRVGPFGNLFNADCRNSVEIANFSGHYFTWCAVMRFAHVLCPYPWRVPTREDFAILHQNLGYTLPPPGSSVPTIANTYMGTSPGANGGAWGGARFTARATSLATGNSRYWSSTEQSRTNAFLLHFCPANVIPEYSRASKANGFAVRCVR